MAQTNATGKQMESTAATSGKGGAIARRRRVASMIARAWSDEAFKQKLLQDPKAAFAEYDLELPAGKQVRVVEDTADVTYFVLPARPRELGHVGLERSSDPASAGRGPAHYDCGPCGDCENCEDCSHCEHCGGCEGCGHCEHCSCESCGGCEAGHGPGEAVNS